MHSFMISIKCFIQFSHEVLTSSTRRESQFVPSISSKALFQSACLYNQIDLVEPPLSCLVCFHCDCSNRPIWSELASGGIVSQDCRREEDDVAMRSIMEVVPLGPK